VALRSDGTVWKWGLNDVGELGIGSADSNPHPLAVQVTTDKFGAGFSNVVKVANRDYHNIALKADGSVWMWGANDQGQWRAMERPMMSIGRRRSSDLARGCRCH